MVIVLFIIIIVILLSIMIILQKGFDDDYRRLVRLTRKVNHMAGELAALLDAVALIEGKADSLIALTNGLGQFIRDHVNDSTALLAMADELNAKSADVQAALDANPLPEDPA